MGFLKMVVAFAVSLMVALLLAAIFHTRFVIAELERIGVAIAPGEQVVMHIHDFIGFVGVDSTIPYLVVIGVAWLVAMPAAAFTAKLAPFLRMAVFAVAGFVAVGGVLLLLQNLLGLMPIAGARSTLGLICQGVAGGVGGFAFAALTGGNRRGK